MIGAPSSFTLRRWAQRANLGIYSTPLTAEIGHTAGIFAEPTFLSVNLK